MAPITPTWIALTGTSAAVAAGALPPVAALYVTTVSVAVLMGAAFMGYLVAVDDPRPVALYEAAVSAVAGALLLADVTLRFPDIVIGSAPATAERLALAALALVAASAIAAAVPWPRLQQLADVHARPRLRRLGR
ncbi:MAG TPA: hypothetical protein VE777_18310 [Gaiellales bacterium]|nr:hypothetical protein [Gaiellales bacterium]